MPTTATLASRTARLDATFDRIASVPQVDFELRADFARYLCVLVSGFVETAVKELVTQYCRRGANERVANYAERQLLRLRNLKTEPLASLVGAFDPKWKIQLDAYADGPRRAALDSVVSLRNQIAHGESVGITCTQMKDYYKLIKEIIDYLAKLLA